MKKIILIPLCILLMACGLTKSSAVAKKKSKHITTAEKLTNEVVDTAQSYLGTPYRRGGTDKKGMDCSGLMVTSYKSVGIELPRVSSEQAKVGMPVSLNEIKSGDLVFFKASSKAKNINHAGLVTEVSEDNKKILFIHSSTSSGVRIDDLYSDFWRGKFQTARRVIPSLLNKE